MVSLVPVSGLDTDPEGIARFDAWAAVLADVARHDQGEDHDAWSAAELRGLEASASKRRVQVLAVEDREPVGAAGVIAPLLDNEHSAQVFVAVLPAHRRRGVGGRLARWAEDEARALRRSILHAETQSGPGSDDPYVPWLVRRGFAPAQTVLRADLDVRGAVLPVLSTAAGYRLETHVDRMPDADLADRALLARRMSTDAPLGDLDLSEEAWDEQRIRGEDERTRAMGRRIVSTFARDLGTGRLVGYTTVQVPEHAPRLAFQHDTLVLREHRGHGLGLALKVANLRALGDAVPEVRTVRTWNAAENAHMLAVNAAMGFRPSGVLRQWQRHLDP
ncbi:GNAT family N-acetyltransferase [Nostocoides sp. Soil756]|uniref:GNAT family N-acetyltransferase n=1 Tax=Nostocoides sp. Soil756 TaxID=1736399 RepID=UPI0006F37B2C|nr:GNAT family N-acetyltransferase [Tetrasphaera sp. Soil756]KRE62056.1 hypothetical protein ASG78_03040 [Tetrasphaera sp. Soil756]